MDRVEHAGNLLGRVKTFRQGEVVAEVEFAALPDRRTGFDDSARVPFDLGEFAVGQAGKDQIAERSAGTDWRELVNVAD